MPKPGWIAAGLMFLGSLSAAAAHAVVASAGAPGSDPAAPLFDPFAVAEIGFTLSPENRAALEAEPDEYVPAGLEISSTAGAYADTVGLRLKGSSGSFRTLDDKAAFKVKFKEFDGEKFLDLKKLTLNNMVQDPSMLHETLAYQVFRAAGVPAPRTGYAYVELNGEDYGVYLNVETMDDVSLPLWFGSTQHLYEGGYNTDVQTGDLDNFEVDEGDEDDRADLLTLIAALQSTGQSFSERLAPVADLAEMTREWAVEKYVGAWDSYTDDNDLNSPNNYYLHSDADGVFSMIPWGNDQSLMLRIPFDGPGGLLFEGCRDDPSCWERFRKVLEELPGVVTALELDVQAQQLAAMLQPWQQADPRREQSMDEIAEEVENTREYLQVRPADLRDQAYWVAEAPLGGPPPPPPEVRGSAPGDLQPPETSITRAPHTRGTGSKRSPTARLRFESSETGSTFQCRRGGGAPWYGCDSPERFRVGAGEHVFRVRATDPAGNTDPTPAWITWTVRRR